MLKRSAALLSALQVAACAVGPAAPHRREALTQQIADDAAAFNEAYSRAVSGQLLLNVLRARDRQPRYYLAMTGIQDAPSLLSGERAAIGSIPLGQPSDPWGFGSLSVRRETTSRPSYAVQPFGAEALMRTAFRPTPINVFAHYWGGGWPRDLLLLVMVESVVRTENGRAELAVNDANDRPETCAPGDASRACAFEAMVARLLGDIGARRPAAQPDSGAPVCNLLAAYEPARPLRRAEPPPGDDCPATLVVGEASYALRLRSLDDMVYYVGETLRPAYTDAKSVLESRARVRAAGLKGGGAGAPLFRVLKKDALEAPENSYSASVVYQGERYFAGPSIGRSCPEAKPGLCADQAAAGDRSSSVLSLLSELMALNQSADQIKAPSRLIAE